MGLRSYPLNLIWIMPAKGFAVYEAIAVLKLAVGGSIPAMLAAGLLYWGLSRRAAR